MLEFVDKQARDTYHGTSKLVTPIAITIFFWILMMNLLKMIPADFIAKPLELMGVHYWKPVPTADVNATLGMSISVFFLMIVFALRSKGLLKRVGKDYEVPRSGGLGSSPRPSRLALDLVRLFRRGSSFSLPFDVRVSPLCSAPSGTHSLLEQATAALSITPPFWAAPFRSFCF